MAKIHGDVGSVSIANLTAGLRDWDASLDGDLHDITDYADGTDKKYLAGLKGGTASARGFWDAANGSLVLNSEGSLVLNINGTSSISGDAFVNHIGVTHSVDGIVMADFGFTFNGAITQA